MSAGLAHDQPQARRRRHDQEGTIRLPWGLPPAVDPLGGRPIEAEHNRATVGLGVAAVLEVLAASIERQQPLEQPVVSRAT